MPQVKIAIAERLVDELNEALSFEPLRKLAEERLVDELNEALKSLSGPTDWYDERRLARVKGLSIIIWADEHPPPHFHVSYQGEDASFSIVDCLPFAGHSGPGTI
jgi:hypothetical protein